jgi:hypothetical protein
MAYFKVVSQDSLGQTEENHKKPEQSMCTACHTNLSLPHSYPHFYRMPSYITWTAHQPPQ